MLGCFLQSPTHVPSVTPIQAGVCSTCGAGALLGKSLAAGELRVGHLP